jgi:alkanesulfonate monooxygenase SsuD/methylene tetrahydromethanopterin reductase-like flavin-dependent oxidoreductase (luciferase family)
MVEAAGLDGVWKGDGSYFRGQYTEVDPLMWVLLVAAATETIEVGLAAYQVALREPVDLAQRLMTITALTRGRVTCGVGPGSTDTGSLAAVGVPFAQRFGVFHERMATLRRLLDGEPVGAALIPPWPEAVPGPRFVLGAWYGDRSVRLAAEQYDGWMSSAEMTSLRVMADGIRRYRDLGGTRAMTVTCRIDLRGPNRTLDEDGPFDLLCGPEEAAYRVHRLMELGFDDLCLRFVDHRTDPPTPREFTADDLHQIRSLVPRDLRGPYGPR